MLRVNLSSGFSTRSDTNWAVQPQKVAKGLKFGIQEVHSYWAAALRLLFFRISKNRFSHDATDLCLIGAL